MDVTCTEDVGRFAEAAREYLNAERFSANVIAVQVEGMLGGERAAVPDALWMVASERGRVVGAAMHTPPHALFLPRVAAGVAEAIAQELIARDRRLPGVSGERPAADAFATAWDTGTGSQHRLVTSMRMYVLGDLRRPAGVEGDARVAGGADAGLLVDWMKAFHDEAEPHMPLVEVEDLVDRRIRAGGLWLWQRDGARVAFAGMSPPAAGVARIGPVYTPPALRRNGFGAAVTAAASAAAVASGAEDVVLYTDLANTTSNAIYQAIGYVADHDAVGYAFVRD